ncbi:MAG: hypothetical protein JSV09_15280 [Thermoplasmata archaeon]|nr:MAG: hypothetical protein JSV09_15280 [Thermoplasmata archaeon]
MTSSDKTARKRYIAFQITAPRIISRNEFISAIREKEKDEGNQEDVRPWLTVFENNKGILRCAHTNKEKAMRLLVSIKSIGRDKVPVKVVTLGTSGTIKKAKRRYMDRE